MRTLKRRQVGSYVMSGDSDPSQGEAGRPIGLTEAYSVESPDDNRALYAKWADTYESGVHRPQAVRVRPQCGGAPLPGLLRRRAGA